MSSECRCHTNEFCFYCEVYSPVVAERDRYKALCLKSFDFIDTMTDFANDNLQVYGWHLNGDAEPFENMVNENLDSNLWQELKEIKEGGSSK